ncbi:MAG: HAD-IA family hydrolase [Actinomycetota bacterium]|nr:HAD-IA family hydrolase [Actinomycetota bacterium]
MTVTAVAFDLMDTVVRDPFREALTAATGRGVADVLRDREPGVWSRFECGDLSEEEYFASFRCRFDVVAFHTARRAGYRWLPGMRELLDDIAGHATRVAASNYPVWVEELADSLLADRFERVLASHHLGVRKPDRRFYRRLCREIGSAPGHVVFVDDRDENVDAARQAGLRAHRFVDADDVRRRLRDEGLAV